jgi:hypothetical protein
MLEGVQYSGQIIFTVIGYLGSPTFENIRQVHSKYFKFGEVPNLKYFHPVPLVKTMCHQT